MSKKILAINSGSSSIKFKLYLMPEEKLLISGSAENLGSSTSQLSYKTEKTGETRQLPLKNHSEAIDQDRKSVV